MVPTFNHTIKKALSAMALGCVALLISGQNAWANPWTAPVMSDYVKLPPFASYSVKPNIMIILDNSGKMNMPAYNEDYNGEPYNLVPDSIYLVGDESIDAAANDMEEDTTTGDVTDGTTPLHLDTTHYVGIRFQDVPIAEDDIIESAYIQFIASGNTAGASKFEIRAEAVNNAKQLNAGASNKKDITGRTFTAASITWTVETNWIDGEVYNTVDISDLLNEIRKLEGWTSGNSILFGISGAGDPRQVHSREDGQAMGPVLRIQLQNQAPKRYYGYYNPDYFYNFESNVFNPAYKKISYDSAFNSWEVEALDGVKSILDDSKIAPAEPSDGYWDGNWLNWCAMRRIDVMRKVLMGGLATSRQGNGNSQNIGIAPAAWDGDADYWNYYQYFNTGSNEGPAVSPYDGNYRFYMQGGNIRARAVDSDADLDSYSIVVDKQIKVDPDDFYDGNLAGILQRVGDRARWGNMWFNYGYNEKNNEKNNGGYIQTNIGGNTTNMISNLQNTACDTYAPLAETFYVALSNFAQQDVAEAGYPVNVEQNSNLSQDPYYDQKKGQFVRCAKSFVLLLTHGASTKDGAIPDMINGVDVKDYDNDDSEDTDKDGTYDCVGDCDGSDYLDDLALYARTNDLRQGDFTGLAKTGLEGDQNIILYTVYAFDDDPKARQLLKDAARNGGFEDYNDNGLPDGTYASKPEERLEWDQNGDGDPDTFYEARDGYKLKEKLLQAINDILARASSGTAASVVANSRTGEGSLYQSIFYPATTRGANTVTWVGQLQSLMVDAYGNMREDTNGNQELEVGIDRVVKFTDEETDPVKLYETPANYRKRFDENDPEVTLKEEKEIAEIKFLWTSSNWLNEISDTDITVQRTYAAASPRRYIFTFVDKNGNMAADADDGEVLDFIAPTTDPPAPGWDTAKDPNNFWAYIHPFNPYAPDVEPSSSAVFQEYVTRQMGRTVNYIRGQDQPLETTDSGTLLPAFRERKIDYDDDGSVETWRLGDIIYSTPMVVAAPAENYDIIWRDRSYVAFYNKYCNRRNVIYVGANDGMLHAFNAGFFDYQTSRFLTQPIDQDTGDPDTSYTGHDLGAELWAYVPFNLLPHLHWLTDSNYEHVYYMDQQPRIFDACIFADDATHPNGWGTVMVAGMRFGGGRIAADIDKSDGPYSAGLDKSMSSAFCIFDITDPEQAPKLLAEINFPELGFTTCLPGVIPMRDLDTTQTGLRDSKGTNLWYLLFGSGPIDADGAFTTALTNGTSSRQGVMYALDLVKLAQEKKVVTLTKTGEKTYPVAAGDYWWVQFDEANSFASRPVSLDLDRDFNTEVVYFGTSFGNHTEGFGGKLRRIVPDISNTSPWTWVNNSTLIDLSDLDLATDGLQGRPITAPPTLTTDDFDNRWVFFGTGRYLSSEDGFNKQQQSYYGVKEPYTPDDTGEKKFHFMNSAIPDTVYVNELKDVSTYGVYESGLKIVYSDDSGQKTYDYGNGDFASLETEIEEKYRGWVMDFTFAPEQERNLGQAVLAGELLTFTSYLPSDDLCSIGGTSQVYALYYRTGTAYWKSIFGVDETTDDGQGHSLVLKRADLGKGMTISPNIHVGKASGSQAYIQTSTGAIRTLSEENPGEVRSKPLDWTPDTLCP